MLAVSLLAGLFSAALLYYFRVYQSEDDLGLEESVLRAPTFPPSHQSFNACKEFPEMDDLVTRYFRNSSQIDSETFEILYREATEPWKSRGASVLIQVINNTIYVDRRHFTTYLPWDKLRMHHLLDRLQRIISQRPLPNLEFILNTHDCPMREPKYGPIFSITRCQGMNVIPLPQWFTWRDGSFEGWDAKMRHYHMVGESVPWGEKQPQAIFRGNVRPSVLQFNITNGRLQFVNVTKDTIRDLGRTKIYMLGQQRPDLLDVGLYGKGLDSSRGIIDLIPEYEFRPPISMSDQSARFRYVIYAEGACGWADRLKVLLVSGMVIFLQDTPCQEFFQPLLSPWVHYVPISNDFSNLVERLAWANANEDEAREIGENGADLGIRLNSQAAWDYYVGTCLERYAKLLRYSPQRRIGTVKFIMGTKCPNRRDLQCDDSKSFLNMQ